MLRGKPPFTLGVEEEYLIVDKDTRQLIVEPPEELMQEAEEKLGSQVTSELLRSQMEVGTRVCNSVQEAEEELKRLRSAVIEVTGKYNLAPIAASTHPFSDWRDQKQTEKDRYNALTLEMQGAARRLVICGMHVHVGIDDNELRIDLMNQMSYFLPHLLALSCSSPFWEGNDTGLKSVLQTTPSAQPRVECVPVPVAGHTVSVSVDGDDLNCGDTPGERRNCL
jgi:carboxylate-amine ligase